MRKTYPELCETAADPLRRYFYANAGLIGTTNETIQPGSGVVKIATHINSTAIPTEWEDDLFYRLTLKYRARR